MPNLKYLNIKAAERLTKNHARDTSKSADWTSYKLLAAFRRHTICLQRWRCRKSCLLSIDASTPTPKAWHVMQVLLVMPKPRNTFENLHLSNEISLPDIAETFADVFSFTNARLPNIDERLIPMQHPYLACKLDKNFDLGELERAPDTCRQKAPLVRRASRIRSYTILTLQFLQFFFSCITKSAGLEILQCPGAPPSWDRF